MTLGRIDHDAALEMHLAGYSREAIAERAGVTPHHITAWRRRNRLSRRYRRTGLATADRQAYHREWKRRRANGQQRAIA